MSVLRFRLLRILVRNIWLFAQSEAGAEKCNDHLKRLLIASKACSVAWKLMRNNSDEAQEVKELLAAFQGG